MKCSAWLSLAISVCSALVFAGPAGGHVTPDPHWVSAGEAEEIALTAHNERNATMTGFSVTVPDDFRLVEARSADGWTPEVKGSTATWAGGSVDAAAAATFSIELEAPVEPGPAALDAAQGYPGGEVVRWGVQLTVTPASDPPGQTLGWAVLIAFVGLAAAAAIGFALLRRSRSLQER